MMETNVPLSPPYQKPLKSMRQPLIPTEEEMEKQEEGFFGSLGKLFASMGAAAIEILGAIFPILRRKPGEAQYQQKQFANSTSWPIQESFVIPDEDEPPPSVEARYPTPRKTYDFMSKDDEKIQQLRQSRVFYNDWDRDGEFNRNHHHQQQQQQRQSNHQQQNHHHRRHHSSIPYTYYERSLEKTNEVVFGAVQENGRKREAMKPVDYGAPVYDHHKIRTRMGYTHRY